MLKFLLSMAGAFLFAWGTAGVVFGIYRQSSDPFLMAIGGLLWAVAALAPEHW